MKSLSARNHRARFKSIYAYETQQRYEPLLNIARLFIEGSALQLAAGDVTAFAFVFDMNQLFEAFAVNFIRRHRYDILPVELR